MRVPIVHLKRGKEEKEEEDEWLWHCEARLVRVKGGVLGVVFGFESEFDLLIWKFYA